MRKARLIIPFLVISLVSPASALVLAPHSSPAPQLYVPPSMAGSSLVGSASGSPCPSPQSCFSLNWSGYVVTDSNGNVSAVYGSWVVPRVACKASANAYSAFWVGIDGWFSNSKTVEQGGTDSDCQNGSPTYYAWYEFYPNPAALITSVKVAPGDLITASVTYNFVTSNFTVSISSSGGGSNSTSQPVSDALRNSAEWIVERPATCDSESCILPLANFGTAGLGFDYTGSERSNYATVNATTGPIGSFPFVAVTMVHGESLLARPTALTADGTSFLISSGGTFVQIACAPLSIAVGSSAACKATVTGTSPTGTVAWTSGGPGKFSSASCVLSKGACSVKYTPTFKISPAALIATYAGDSNNPSSFGSFYLGVTEAASKTSVTCTPTLTPLGSSKTVECTATVTGYSPTGKVSWSQSGTGSVSFSSGTCTLAKGLCSVTLTGASTGTITIDGAYAGNTNNVGSSGSAKLAVERAVPALSLWCTSSSVAVGHSATCTATLKNYFGSVAGEEVTWSRAAGSGGVSFSSSTCALSSKGTCTVTVMGTKAGSVTFEAVYAGGTNNIETYRTYVLKIT